MRAIIAVFLAICVYLSVISPALAWNDKGHMVSALLAFRRLNETDRARIHEILKQHPHYEDYLAKKRPEIFSEAEWAFMRAATWADWIRPPRNLIGDAADHPIHKFNRSTWHYINYPYRPGVTELPTALAQEENIENTLEFCVAYLKREKTDDPLRVPSISEEANAAVRLTWLFHLVGDLQQPLHATALIDEAKFPMPPHGDRGGNSLMIRSDEKATPLNLHAYWDQLLGSDASPGSIKLTAEELESDEELKTDQLTELAAHPTIHDWASESFFLAVQYAYLGGKLPLVPMDDTRLSTGAPLSPPVIPAEAHQNAKNLARRRIALAGARLANMLHDIGEARKP